MSGLNLEIWFPQQNEVTIFLESSFPDPDEEKLHETSLFALYAARQIANLRQDGMSLATVLASIDTRDPLPVIEAQLDAGLTISSPSRQSGGRKGFTAQLRPDSRGFFKLNPHGFGMFGQGVGYYAPTSTLALLWWLLRRRQDDPIYQRALAATAENVGLAGSRGMISVTSQANIAMQAATAAWGEAFYEDAIEEFELSEDALAALQEHNIDFPMLVRAAGEGLHENVGSKAEEGMVVVIPDHVSLRFCRTQVVMAAGFADEEGTPLHRASRAMGAAIETDDDEMVSAAEAHYDRELERLIDEHRLGPIVEALRAQLFTSDPERAAGL